METHVASIIPLADSGKEEKHTEGKSQNTDGEKKENALKKKQSRA